MRSQLGVVVPERQPLLVLEKAVAKAKAPPTASRAKATAKVPAKAAKVPRVVAAKAMRWELRKRP